MYHDVKLHAQKEKIESGKQQFSMREKRGGDIGFEGRGSV
jgi:hypothetical protein